jgi:drug/metabolite transporter (DMT)-like permease
MQRSSPPSIRSLPGSPNARWIGAGFCAISAASFSMLAILGKLAYQQGLTLPQMLGYRFTGAALLLFAYLALFRRQKVFPGWRLALIFTGIGAFVYALNAGLFFGAFQRIPASLASLLLFIYPIFVALAEGLINRRAPTKLQWFAMTMAVLGVVLTTGLNLDLLTQDGQAVDVWGALMAIGAAVLYASYTLLSTRYIHLTGPWVGTAWLAAGAGLSFNIVGLATGAMNEPLTPNAILIIMGLILISTILPLGAFLAGIQYVGPTTAAFISTLEPVFTVLLAFLILGESLAMIQGVGGSLVIISALLLSLPGRARVPVAPSPKALTDGEKEA